MCFHVWFLSLSWFFALWREARPWVEDALVGMLPLDAVLFVWDHCFMLGWQVR